MSTSGTAVDVTAQRGCPTVLNCVQHLQMLPLDPLPAALDEVIARLPHYIGHLNQWSVHFFTRFLERATPSGLDNWIESSGLATACKCRRDKCR
jgi:hypothetical protein